ncbi:porin family protein [Spirosoma fluminis]
MTKRFTLVVATLVLCSMASFAQVRVGVTGAVQFANQTLNFGSVSLKGTNKIGFQAGLLLDAPLSESFSIRPQLLYSVKGTKLANLNFGLGAGDVTTTFNYLEVPIQLLYNIEAGPGFVTLGAGPYVAYALNGKTTGEALGQSDSQSIEFGSGEDQTKRLDYGLRLSAGYELSSGISISGYYAPGLGNLSNTSGGKATNTAFGLSLGFLFGGE